MGSMRSKLTAGRAIVLWMAVAAMLAARAAPAEDPRYEPAVRPGELGTTSASLAGKIYGAQSLPGLPIGGGDGYTSTVTGGNYTCSTTDQLLTALGKAQPGEVVYIAGTAELELTERGYAEQLVIEVPAGVTLASNRGVGGSQGALLYSFAFQTAPLIRVMGAGARITGLRLRGPDPLAREDHYARSFGPAGKGQAYYDKFPASVGIATEFIVEIDNCEFYGWSNAAVQFEAGGGHWIHHNHIHHCARQGLGQSLDSGAAGGLIESNLFDHNQHAFQCDGSAQAAWELRNNVFHLRHGADVARVELGAPPDGAGHWFKLEHNTFIASGRRAIALDGLPEAGAWIAWNWFYHAAPGPTVIEAPGRTLAMENAYGNPPALMTENYDFRPAYTGVGVGVWRMLE